MTSKNILFFADRLPPLIGGMEMHAKYFIEHFSNHPKFPIQGIITKDSTGSDLLLQKGETKKLDIRKLNLRTDIIFFNSGRWIEELKEIKKIFPSAKFIYRTGGNEILKAPLKLNKELDHKTRQAYWVQTLNRTIDLIITNSSYTETRLHKLNITCPFVRCVGGVNTEALSGLKIPNEVLTIFCSARFVPYKNHALLLKVVSTLKSKGYSFKLKLAGDGPLLESAKKQVIDDKLEQVVEFLGVLDNERVCKEITNADIYIQFSKDQITQVPGGSYIHSEGMGRAILEALSAGTFVIAGNSGALSEVVTAARGLLLDLDDLEESIKQIEMVFRKPPAKLPFDDSFSWSKIFDRYEQIFSQTNLYKPKAIPS